MARPVEEGKGRIETSKASSCDASSVDDDSDDDEPSFKTKRAPGFKAKVSSVAKSGTRKKKARQDETEAMPKRPNGNRDASGDLDSASNEPGQNIRAANNMTASGDVEGSSESLDANDLALFDKWCNPYTYSCKICNAYTCKRRDTFTSHISRKLSTRTQDYIKTYGDQGPEPHQCKLCNKDCYHDIDKLRGHFKNIHDGLSVEKYFVEHIKPYLPKNHPIFQQEASQEIANGQLSDQESEESSPFEQWIKVKEYVCQVFKKYKTKQYPSLLSHAAAKHQINSDEYESKFGQVKKTSNERLHCKLCGKMGSKMRLVYHFENTNIHKIGLEEYFKRYVQEENGNNNSEVTFKGSTSESLNKGSVAVSWKEISQWSNQCQYDCNICGIYSIDSERAFKKHMKVKHQLDITGRMHGKWDQLEGKVTVRETFHKCLACNSVKLHEMQAIQMHLKHHCKNLTLRQYYEQFVLPQKNDQANQMEAEKCKKAEQAFRHWAFQCQWICPICAFSTNKGSNIWSHLKEIHNSNVSKLKKDGHGDPVTKKVTHQCKLCQVDILQDPFYLDTHLRGVHKMTIREYYNQYICTDDEKQECVKDLTELKKAKIEDQLFNNWTKGVQYQCQVCKMILGSVRALKDHLRAQHQVKYKDHVKIYKQLLMQHKCQVCGNNVLQNRPSLQHHKSYYHEMDNAQYFRKFILPDALLRRLNGIDIFELVVVNALSLGMETDLNDWQHQVKIECQLCQEYTTNLIPGLIKHIDKCHNVSKKKYLSKFGEFWTSENTEMHSCKLCGNPILMKRANIQDHLIRVHKNMDIGKYFRNHVMTRTFYLADIQNIPGVYHA